MEIIEELPHDDRADFLSQFQEHPHFGEIKDALSRNYCFRVRVYSDDYNNILINSSTEDQELPLSEYPTLKVVIDNIKKNDSFFDQVRRPGMLSGARVKQFHDEYTRSNQKPEHFFLIDRDEFPEMNRKARFYVRDGMHNLVAYGLATQMREDCFPIVGYYCSNKRYCA